MEEIPEKRMDDWYIALDCEWERDVAGHNLYMLGRNLIFLYLILGRPQFFSIYLFSFLHVMQLCINMTLKIIHRPKNLLLPPLRSLGESKMSLKCAIFKIFQTYALKLYRHQPGVFGAILGKWLKKWSQIIYLGAKLPLFGTQKTAILVKVCRLRN